MQQLVIIRGLPGSGKSTLARSMKGFSHYEADTYFLDEEGDYHYDKSMIKEAHEWCRKSVSEALASGKNVVVSNTFTRIFEMTPYFDLAARFNIKPMIIKMEGNFGNIHNVPEEVIRIMKQRWEDLA